MKDAFNSCNAASEYLQKSAVDLLAANEAVTNLPGQIVAYEEKAVEMLKNKRHTTDENEADVPQPSQKRAQ